MDKSELYSQDRCIFLYSWCTYSIKSINLGSTSKRLILSYSDVPHCQPLAGFDTCCFSLRELIKIPQQHKKWKLETSISELPACRARKADAVAERPGPSDFNW